MSPELGMEKMKLFISDGDGNYVPFEGLKNYADLCEKEKDGGVQDASDTQISEEDLRQALDELRKQIEEFQPYDTILMNDTTFLMLLAHGDIWTEGKEFYLDGMMVFTSPEIEKDKAYLMDRYTATMYLESLKEKENPYPDGKPEPKKCHCRICGQAYTNKSEAKECARSHSWQNRRGRR